MSRRDVRSTSSFRPSLFTRGTVVPPGKAIAPRGHERVPLRDSRGAPGRVMGRRVECVRGPSEGVARVEVFFSSGACRAFEKRGWSEWVAIYAVSHVFTKQVQVCFRRCVGGFVLSLAMARGLELRAGCILLGLASRAILPRVLPKRFTRVQVSNSPAAFLHHPVSVGCMSERHGRM